MKIALPDIKILAISLLTMTSCYSQKTGVVVATHNETVVLNETKSYFQEELKLNRPVNIDGDKKIVLVFEKLEVKVNPDGAYEIYVSLDKGDVAKLESTAPEFANVLDLFSAMTPGVESVEVDLSPALNKIAPGRKTIRSLFVTILFRGNTMPNRTTQSKNAGEVKFSLKLELY